MTTTAPSATTSSPATRTAPGSFWRRDVYTLIALACVLFVVLTAVAMLLYPGGTIVDPTTQGYRFFENYFSDLGLTHSRSGTPNLPAMLCFIVALVSVALALGAFFWAFTRCFAADPRALRRSRIAAVVGSITALCFIGVAAAPRDLAYVVHIVFELTAFPTFLVAAAFAIAALRALERAAPPGLPRRFLWGFVVLAVALAAYIALLAFGPPDWVLTGERIDITGQKLIVYTAIATICVQALQARRLAPGPDVPAVHMQRAPA